MKKKLLMIFTTLILLTCLALSISAAGTTATTDSKSCAKGDTVNISVSVTSTSGVRSGGVDIIFDESKLELIGGEWNIPGALMPTVDVSKKKAGFALSSAGTVGGKILTLSFRVLSDAPLGDTDILCKVILKDGSTELPVTNISGKITITCKHNFTKETTDYPASPASCTSAAKYYYTCSICGQKGTTTYTVGSALSHTFDKQVATNAYLVKSVKCVNEAEYYYSCSCGAKGTQKFTADASWTHNFGSNWFVSTDGHWHQCIDCEAKKDFADHSKNVDGICSKCNFVISEQVHTHSFSDAWHQNADAHWHECSCGIKDNLELHNWDNGREIKPATTSAEGENLFTCTDCNVTKTVTTEKLKVNAPTPGKLTVKALVSLVKVYKIEIAIIAFAGIMLLLFIEAIVFFICKLVKKKKARALAKADSCDEVEPVEQINEACEPQKLNEPENGLQEILEEVSEDNPGSNI